MTLLIDNYDSFAYNLYQYVGSLDPQVQVIRNDDLTVAEIEALHPTAVILSPGPGRPADAGVCEALIPALAGKCKMLGVCLGHQAICEAFGGRITYAKELMHGRECNMTITCPGRPVCRTQQSHDRGPLPQLGSHRPAGLPESDRYGRRTAKLWRCSIKNMKFTVCNSTRSR